MQERPIFQHHLSQATDFYCGSKEMQSLGSIKKVVIRFCLTGKKLKLFL